jgi:Gelsolin repeat.
MFVILIDRLLNGGAASGFNHVTDTFVNRLFHIKGRRSPTVTQHPISWEHFNSGDVFIMDTKDVVFVWVGRSANNMEKLQAAKVSNRKKYFLSPRMLFHVLNSYKSKNFVPTKVFCICFYQKPIQKSTAYQTLFV